jgi:hypothetical protein
MKTDLTAERLRELLSYDPETGVFTWRVRIRGNVHPGMASASSRRRGYARVKVDGHAYAAHRLAWLYVYGEWPAGFIDHKNRDRADNRISNLRIATLSQNQHNRGASRLSSTGVKGVYLDRKRGGYQVSLAVNYKSVYIGRCKTIAEGAELYRAAVSKHHRDFGCTE